MVLDDVTLQHFIHNSKVFYLYTEFHIPSYSVSLVTPVKLKTHYIFTQISYFCCPFQETTWKLK